MLREDKAEIRGGYAHSEITRRALLLAAIRVIAEQGVAGASLRSINVAAGSRNASAAHYHFGTKLGVIEAALELLYAEVARQQDELMNALEARVAQGRPVGVREILEAAYLPYLGLINQKDFGQAAAKFVSRLLVESDADLQAMLNRQVAPIMRRCLALLQAALPQVPEPVLRIRLFITVTNVLHGAGDMPALFNSPLGNLAPENPLELLHTLFEYLEAAVSAPVQVMVPTDETRMAATLLGQGKP
ncbi:MAG: hypothetical protein RLZZ303_2433 [Candidatus Hydrogenedentota bacterium]|jgi:AcrR family transcriptional regulator